MADQLEKTDAVQESPDKTSDKATEKVYDQTESGRQDLADQQKKYVADLKSGMPSGVTGEIGKPEIFDSSESVAAFKAKTPGDLDKTATKQDDPVESESKAKKGDGDKTPGSTDAKGDIKNSKEVKQPGLGSNVDRDAEGRPTEVKYADGTSNKVTYDDHGNVTKLESRNGTVLTQNGDHYDVTKPDGSKGSDFKGVVGVTPEGDVMAINENGTGQIRHANGDETRLNPDKSQTTEDLKGQVKQVVYPDGTKEQIVRDKDGNPTELKSDTSGSWKKNGEGTWDHYQNGKKDDHLQDVQVKSDGTIVGTGRDGEKWIQHTDGNEETKDKTITRDDKDRPTEMKYPDGTSSKVDYDDKGNPTKIHERDGGTLEKEGDHWTETRPDGSKRTIDHTVGVTPEGDVVAVKPDGSGTVRHADGSKTDLSSDQSQVTTTMDGKVTNVTYPDGKTAKIEYDESGNPTRIKEREGGTLVNENGRWNEIGPDGKSRPVPHQITVDENGDIRATRPDKGGVVRHRDGSRTSFDADGNEETKDIHGNPVE